MRLMKKETLCIQIINKITNSDIIKLNKGDFKVKNSFKAKCAKSNVYFLLAGIFAIGYIVFICLSYNFDATWIEIAKDVLGFLSFGVSFSLAVKIKVTVNNYKAEHQTIVNGNLTQNNIDDIKSQELTEKKNVLTTINTIATNTDRLAVILSMKNESTIYSFVPINEQKRIIRNHKNFTVEIENYKSTISNGLLIIKDTEFTVIAKECIATLNDIKDTFNKIYEVSQNPMLNSFVDAEIEAVNELNKYSNLLREKIAGLRNLI